MKVESESRPRYDLYIVTEHADEETGMTENKDGILNESYTHSEGEERLRIEITDEPVVGNNNNVQDDSAKPKVSMLFYTLLHNTYVQIKKKVNFLLDQTSILPSLHRQAQERFKERNEGMEPTCFPVFRWTIMMMGVVMLLAVLFILGQLVMEFKDKYKHSIPTTQVTSATTQPSVTANMSKLKLL